MNSNAIQKKGIQSINSMIQCSDVISFTLYTIHYQIVT